MDQEPAPSLRPDEIIDAPQSKVQPDEVVHSTAAASQPNREGTAIAALILGIINLGSWCIPVCGLPLAIAGIVVGILGLKSTQRTMAIIGLALSGISFFLSIIVTVLGIALIPAAINNGNFDFRPFFQ